jgi:hypothetical protein
MAEGAMFIHTSMLVRLCIVSKGREDLLMDCQGMSNSTGCKEGKGSTHWDSLAFLCGIKEGIGQE